MYKWIIRISAAAVGTVLLVMIKSLNFNPILYISHILRSAAYDDTFGVFELRRGQ